MRRSVLTAVVTATTACVLAMPALAAEPTVVVVPAAPASPPPTPPPAPFDWTGLYLGASGGYGWGTAEIGGVAPPVAVAAEIEYGSMYSAFAGWLLAVQAGYNHQFSGGLVLGVEADFMPTFIGFPIGYGYGGGGEEVVEEGLTRDIGYGSHYGEASLDWLSTLRVRLGFAFDRVLPYVTGGLAAGHFSAGLDYGYPYYVYGSTRAEGGEWDYEDSGINWGWTIGGGVEFAVTDWLSLRAEYLYVDLADRLYFGETSTPAPTGALARDYAYDGVTLGANIHLARVGFNVLF